MGTPASQEPPNAPLMKYCMSCGKQMPSDMNFCGHCGRGQLPTSNSDSTGRGAANASTEGKSSAISGGVLLAIAVVALGGYLAFVGVTSIFNAIGQGEFHAYYLGLIGLGIGALWRAFKR